MSHRRKRRNDGATRICMRDCAVFPASWAVQETCPRSVPSAITPRRRQHLPSAHTAPSIRGGPRRQVDAEDF